MGGFCEGCADAVKYGRLCRSCTRSRAGVCRDGDPSLLDLFSSETRFGLCLDCQPVPCLLIEISVLISAPSRAAIAAALPLCRSLTYSKFTNRKKDLRLLLPLRERKKKTTYARQVWNRFKTRTKANKSASDEGKPEEQTNHRAQCEDDSCECKWEAAKISWW